MEQRFKYVGESRENPAGKFKMKSDDRIFNFNHTSWDKIYLFALLHKPAALL